MRQLGATGERVHERRGHLPVGVDVLDVASDPPFATNRDADSTGVNLPSDAMRREPRSR